MTNFNNRICCDKKAYFFGYIYPKYMRDYNKHKKVYNQLSRIRFSKKLDELKDMQDKPDDVKKLLRGYYNYMPLFNSKCTMNILTRYVEDAEKEVTNTWSKSIGGFDYRCLMSSDDVKIDFKLIKKLKPIVSAFNTYYNLITKDKRYLENVDIMEGLELSDRIYASLFESYDVKLSSVCSNIEKLTDHIIYLYYTTFKTHPKSLLWNIFDGQILENIKTRSGTVCFPVKDIDGEDYLGEKYKLLEIEKGV